MNVVHCKHGFKYLMVGGDGLIVEKKQAGVLYGDGVCLTEAMNKTCKGILII